MAAALLLCSGAAWADASLVIADVTVPQGGTVELPIGFAFGSSESYVGFQLNLLLPEGISTVRDEDNQPVYVVDATSLGTKYEVIASVNDGFAALPRTSTPIQGASGTLITITLAAEASLAAGTELTATVTNAKFTVRDDEGSASTVNVPDFTFAITIGAPDDGRIKFNENSTRLPTYSAGEKGDITMTRNIKAGQWCTLVLPFNLTKANAAAVFGEDVEFAKFSGFDVDYGDDEENVVPLGITVNFTSYSIPTRGNLAGGTPVLIKTSKDIAEIQLDGVTLTDGVKDVDVSDEYGTPGTFTASLVKTLVPVDALFIAGNRFYYSIGETAIKAFRGWFELGAVLDKETDFGVKMSFNIDGVTTGISEMEHVKCKVDEAVYDLSGRRMAKPRGKGVYVVGGRKVVVK